MPPEEMQTCVIWKAQWIEIESAAPLVIGGMGPIGPFALDDRHAKCGIFCHPVIDCHRRRLRASLARHTFRSENEALDRFPL
jgi:hypothetical protein